MHIIKLSATPSTNNYLKQLYSQQVVANFTIVVASNQLKGKGQMGTSWESESGKNLTFSILLKDLIVDVKQLFTLNILVSLALVEVLERYKIPNVTVKWPNDIMSGNLKLGGILIENSIKSDGEVISIVGIGFNINQLYFEKAPKATSLHLISGKTFNLDELLLDFCTSIKQNLTMMEKDTEKIWVNYHQKLFKKGIPMVFEDVHGIKFMGIIQKVSNDGLLHILLEDDSIAKFGVKEIKMLY